MRIASFNVENMFRRAVALNFLSPDDGKPILTEYAKLNNLLQETDYTTPIKNQILASLEKLGLKKSNESKFAILRENHGHLLKRPTSGPPQVIAKGRSRPGTFGNGTAKDKIDFILLSPELFARVTNGGVERRGVWGGTNGTLFPHFPEITKAIEAASDHATIFADLDL